MVRNTSKFPPIRASNLPFLIPLHPPWGTVVTEWPTNALRIPA